MVRVFAVDDSPTQLQELRFILESAGYEVESATSGEEALRKIGGQRLDVVVSDIVMPGISGYELCRQIKSDPTRRDMPVVLLTTLSDPLDIIQGLEAGADNFITKPYEPDYLLARLKTLLENRRMRADGRLKVGLEVLFLGKKFTVTSDKEQILDLLITTFEDIVRTNAQLQEKQAELARAKAKLEEYAQRLEGEVVVTEGKYRTLMDHANDLIFVVRDDGTVVEVNRRIEEVLGRPRAEIVGTHCKELLVSEDRDASAETFTRLLAQGTISDVECRFCRQGGAPVAVEISATLVDLGGERVALAIGRDVTERKRAEEALAQSQAELRQAQKLEAIGRLAGGVAHDFNNFLTAINGYSDLLLLRLPPASPYRKEIEEIKKAGQRSAALTRQLLAFGRKQVLEPRVINPSSVILDMENLLQRLIGERIELRTHVSPESGCVLADPSQIEQVLLNLVVNARDAMPDGGRLVIETRETQLDAQHLLRDQEVRPGAYVMMAVTDTGTGISSEVQAHIFEPFFTTKEAGKGTGLGLSTVYGIVRQSGGYIWVYSELGRGTTFKIYLPRVGAAVAPAAPEADHGSVPRGKETILVAEDEDLVRDLIVQVLEMHGYKVIATTNGQEALDACARTDTPIHMMLTDVVMPGVSGPELARRARATRRDLRVVFMSGYTAATVSETGVPRTDAYFLQKPFSPDALARKVREVLDSK